MLQKKLQSRDTYLWIGLLIFVPVGIELKSVNDYIYDQI